MLTHNIYLLFVETEEKQIKHAELNLLLEIKNAIINYGCSYRIGFVTLISYYHYQGLFGFEYKINFFRLLANMSHAVIINVSYSSLVVIFCLPMKRTFISIDIE